MTQFPTFSKTQIFWRDWSNSTFICAYLCNIIFFVKNTSIAYIIHFDAIVVNAKTWIFILVWYWAVIFLLFFLLSSKKELKNMFRICEDVLKSVTLKMWLTVLSHEHEIKCSSRFYKWLFSLIKMRISLECLRNSCEPTHHPKRR